MLTEKEYRVYSADYGWTWLPIPITNYQFLPILFGIGNQYQFLSTTNYQYQYQFIKELVKIGNDASLVQELIKWTSKHIATIWELIFSIADSGFLSAFRTQPVTTISKFFQQCLRDSIQSVSSQILPDLPAPRSLPLCCSHGNARCGGRKNWERAYH